MMKPTAPAVVTKVCSGVTRVIITAMSSPYRRKCTCILTKRLARGIYSLLLQQKTFQDYYEGSDTIL
jgi:hypothetical protein